MLCIGHPRSRVLGKAIKAYQGAVYGRRAYVKKGIRPDEPRTPSTRRARAALDGRRSTDAPRRGRARSDSSPRRAASRTARRGGTRGTPLAPLDPAGRAPRAARGPGPRAGAGGVRARPGGRGSPPPAVSRLRGGGTGSTPPRGGVGERGGRAREAGAPRRGDHGRRPEPSVTSPRRDAY